MKHSSGRMVGFFLMAALALPATLFAEPERASVVVTASYPVTGSLLPLDQPLYLRIRYQSAAPLRFQAATPFTDKAGVMLNLSPLYPSGQGEALVWIAFRAERHLDEIRVKVMDEQWRPVQSLRVPVRARSGRHSEREVSPACLVITPARLHLVPDMQRKRRRT